MAYTVLNVFIIFTFSLVISSLSPPLHVILYMCYSPSSIKPKVETK